MKDTILEIVGEIVLTLIFFGIGALIVRAFGARLDSDGMDDELIILIGIVVFAVIIGIVFALVKLIKKIIKK